MVGFPPEEDQLCSERKLESCCCCLYNVYHFSLSGLIFANVTLVQYM